MKYLFIILFYFILLTNVDAFNSKGHQSIVEILYYKSDFSLQRELNLSLLKEGSTAPDLKFHDTVVHHYPNTYPLADRWLKASKNNYSLKDYNKASHAFGVASHYIADSFISPHYISKEPGSLHTEFEKIKDYKIRINCYNSLINLNESLKEASRNKEDWTNWTLTKNPEIPKREFEQAANLSMLIFLKIFNSSCNNLETEIIKKDFRINKDIIIFLFLILISYLTFIFNKKYKLIKRIKF